MEKKTDIILDQQFWKDWCKGWDNPNSYSQGGLLTRASAKIIEDLPNISKELKEKLANYMLGGNSYQSHYTSSINWINEFKDKFILPKDGAIVFITGQSMSRAIAFTMKFITERFGEKVAFDSLFELSKAN